MGFFLNYCADGDASLVNTSPSTGNEIFRAFDVLLPVTGAANNNGFLSGAGDNSAIKIRYKQARTLGANIEPSVMVRIHNYHDSGGSTKRGARDVELYGTNSTTAYNNNTYSDTTDLTIISNITLQAHQGGDVEHYEDFPINQGGISYDYYVIRIANNGGDGNYVGIRRIQFFTEDGVTSGTRRELSAYDATTVKATGEKAGDYAAPNALDHRIGCRGRVFQAGGHAWLSGSNGPQKLNFDLGTAVWPSSFAFVNFYTDGTASWSTKGANSIEIYGTNEATAFNELDPAVLTDLTLLATDNLPEHSALDRHEFNITTAPNNGTFRYVVIRVLSNHGDATDVGLRKIAIYSSEPPIPAEITNAFQFNATLHAASPKAASLANYFGFSASYRGAYFTGRLTAGASFRSSIHAIPHDDAVLEGAIAYSSTIKGETPTSYKLNGAVKFTGKLGAGLNSTIASAHLNGGVAFKSRLKGTGSGALKINNEISFGAQLHVYMPRSGTIENTITFGAGIKGIVVDTATGDVECKLTGFSTSGRWA